NRPPRYAVVKATEASLWLAPADDLTHGEGTTAAFLGRVRPGAKAGITIADGRRPGHAVFDAVLAAGQWPCGHIPIDVIIAVAFLTDALAVQVEILQRHTINRHLIHAVIQMIAHLLLGTGEPAPPDVNGRASGQCG